LPPVCSDAENGIALAYLVAILIFFIAPMAIAGGAGAGWLGGELARLHSNVFANKTERPKA
jgi:hypothetical protein